MFDNHRENAKINKKKLQENVEAVNRKISFLLLDFRIQIKGLRPSNSKKGPDPAIRAIHEKACTSSMVITSNLGHFHFVERRGIVPLYFPLRINYREQDAIRLETIIRTNCTNRRTRPLSRPLSLSRIAGSGPFLGPFY